MKKVKAQGYRSSRISINPFRVILGSLFFLFFIFFLFFRPSIVITPSVQTGLYLIDRYSDYNNLERGSYIAFRYKMPDWAKGRYPYNSGDTFMKKIGGIPGDIVKFNPDSHDLKICQKKGDCIDLGVVREKDSEGRPLPLPTYTSLTLQDGQIFAMSDIPEGYDSRYYGLVDYSSFIGKARLILALDL